MFRKHLTQFGMMVYGLIKLWELKVRGRMWRVIKSMYDITQSAVLLEGEISEPFNIGWGGIGFTTSTPPSKQYLN